ncbi:MAG: hypothetical protein IPO85_14775 [Saprospiraceae bacterium]|uniref:Uncharacterized protein n=1 Tax=Candidatus Defluviibacterium haderslevense TaxID=2981993 RepID=A0A9D7SBH7_9BACT|nr:hypothetical protein [Candidatus Defluviibacterium haderslevense]
MKTSMHFIVFVIVLIIAGFYLPLYWMLILSGIVAFFFKISSGKSFIIGFAVGNLVWLGLAYYYHVTSLTSLTGMIGEIFQGLSVSALTFITGLIGGISAGLGAWSGAAIRHLFWPSK